MINAKLVILISAILYFVIAIIRNEMIIKSTPYEKKRYDNFLRKLMKMTRDEKSIREVNYFVHQNVCINIWYLINPLANKFVFIYPGNHGNITYRYDLIRFWYINFSVIIFDYPGYGKSFAPRAKISVPNELLGYCLDIFRLKPKNAILLGENVGCYWLLKDLLNLQKKNLNPRAAIMHTPIFSEKKYLSDQFKLAGLIYPSFMFSDGFCADKYLDQLNGKTPVYIAHSEEDDTIPIVDSEVAVARRNTIKLIRVKGKHNSLVVNHDYIYLLLGIE